VAALAGGYLAALRGWPVVVAGLLAIASAVAYTASPWRLGARGLGDLFVFVFFGVVAVVGTDYVQTGAVRPVALAASIPVGLLAVAILALNNLRDLETDRAAGKRTLAVRLGARATRLQYLFCLAAALAAPAAMRVGGLLGEWFWLPWLVTPLVGLLAHPVLAGQGGAALVQPLKRTARVLLLYSALLALALARTSP
jgi:1,4-dihydroxy-2-naphthoate octaprenyltransferase